MHFDRPQKVGKDYVDDRRVSFEFWAGLGVVDQREGKVGPRRGAPASGRDRTFKVGCAYYPTAKAKRSQERNALETHFDALLTIRVKLGGNARFLPCDPKADNAADSFDERFVCSRARRWILREGPLSRIARDYAPLHLSRATVAASD